MVECRLFQGSENLAIVLYTSHVVDSCSWTLDQDGLIEKDIASVIMRNNCDDFSNYSRTPLL